MYPLAYFAPLLHSQVYLVKGIKEDAEGKLATLKVQVTTRKATSHHEYQGN